MYINIYICVYIYFFLYQSVYLMLCVQARDRVISDVSVGSSHHMSRFLSGASVPCAGSDRLIIV